MKENFPFFGIGTDIIEIRRIQDAISRHGMRFLQKIFTEKERNYCEKFHHSSSHFAARFAAKEAVMKAVGTGLTTPMSWLDIEIINDHLGKPEIVLSERAKRVWGNKHFFLSISHCKEYATATAIALG